MRRFVTLSTDISEKTMDRPSSGAVVKDLDGTSIRVASIRHLIQMKEAAHRPQDLDDIEALRIVAAEADEELE